MMNDFPFAGAVHHHSPENGEPQGVHLHGDHSPSRWSFYLSSALARWPVAFHHQNIPDICHFCHARLLIAHIEIFVSINGSWSSQLIPTERRVQQCTVHGAMHLADDQHSHPHLDHHKDCSHYHPNHRDHYSYPHLDHRIHCDHQSYPHLDHRIYCCHQHHNPRSHQLFSQ